MATYVAGIPTRSARLRSGSIRWWSSSAPGRDRGVEAGSEPRLHLVAGMTRTGVPQSHVTPVLVQLWIRSPFSTLSWMKTSYIGCGLRVPS